MKTNFRHRAIYLYPFCLCSGREIFAYDEPLLKISRSWIKDGIQLWISNLKHLLQQFFLHYIINLWWYAGKKWNFLSNLMFVNNERERLFNLITRSNGISWFNQHLALCKRSFHKIEEDSLPAEFQFALS